MALKVTFLYLMVDLKKMMNLLSINWKIKVVGLEQLHWEQTFVVVVLVLNMLTNLSLLLFHITMKIKDQLIKFLVVQVEMDMLE